MRHDEIISETRYSTLLLEASKDCFGNAVYTGRENEVSIISEIEGEACVAIQHSNDNENFVDSGLRIESSGVISHKIADARWLRAICRCRSGAFVRIRVASR